ncbi:hypothetical protein [Falsiroseomonas selenitidurans]|nr:hypothetical protein [Falsiroseomonas selenitidurans]
MTMTVAIMLGAGMATGAVALAMWQRVNAWRATRSSEWDPY